MATASNPTPTNAANAIMAAELTALQQIREAAVAFDSRIKEIIDGLGYPSNFRSEAVRIAEQLRGNMAYAMTNEIPTLINTYTPVTPYIPPAPLAS